jgi:hypothetical protein
MDKCWIGCDPGSQGCIVAIFEEQEPKVLRLMKATDLEVFEFLSALSLCYDCQAVLEKVWAMPAKGSDGEERKMGAQTMFVFGEGYGKLQAFLTASYIPTQFFVPQTWQKYFGIKRQKTESQTDHKRNLKQAAEKLYPKLKITNDVADAVLIAHFCKHNVR